MIMLHAKRIQAILGTALALSLGIALVARGYEWFMVHSPMKDTNASSKGKKTRREQRIEVFHGECGSNSKADNTCNISRKASGKSISDSRDGRFRNNAIPVTCTQETNEPLKEEISTSECVRKRYQQFVAAKLCRSQAFAVLFKKLPGFTLQDDRTFKLVKTRFDFDTSHIQNVRERKKLVIPSVLETKGQPRLFETANPFGMMISVLYSDFPTESVPPKTDSTATERCLENLSYCDMAKFPSSTAPAENQKSTEEHKEETRAQIIDQFAHRSWAQVWRTIEESTKVVPEVEPPNSTDIAKEVAKGRNGQTPNTTSSAGPQREMSQSQRHRQRYSGQEDIWSNYNLFLAHKILESTLQELGMDTIE